MGWWNFGKRESTATQPRGGAGATSDVSLALDWESIGRLVRVRADASLERAFAITGEEGGLMTQINGVRGAEMHRE